MFFHFIFGKQYVTVKQSNADVHFQMGFYLNLRIFQMCFLHSLEMDAFIPCQACVTKQKISDFCSVVSKKITQFILCNVLVNAAYWVCVVIIKRSTVFAFTPKHE